MSTHNDAPVQLDGLELRVGELGEAFEPDVTGYAATVGVGSLSESSRATGVNGADPPDDSIRRSGAVYVFTSRFGHSCVYTTAFSIAR